MSPTTNSSQKGSKVLLKKYFIQFENFRSIKSCEIGFDLTIIF